MINLLWKSQSISYLENVYLVFILLVYMVEFYYTGSNMTLSQLCYIPLVFMCRFDDDDNNNNNNNNMDH